MKPLICILTIILLSVDSEAQNSDLEISNHEFVYFGDSTELKKVVDYLQSDSVRLIPQEKEICELKISDIGKTGKLRFKFIKFK